MFCRFSINAELIMTASKDLTKEEQIEASLLMEQYLNSLSLIVLDKLKAEVVLRVHMKGDVTELFNETEG